MPRARSVRHRYRRRRTARSCRTGCGAVARLGCATARADVLGGVVVRAATVVLGAATDAGGVVDRGEVLGRLDDVAGTGVVDAGTSVSSIGCRASWPRRPLGRQHERDEPERDHRDRAEDEGGPGVAPALLSARGARRSPGSCGQTVHVADPLRPRADAPTEIGADELVLVPEADEQHLTLAVRVQIHRVVAQRAAGGGVAHRARSGSSQRDADGRRTSTACARARPSSPAAHPLLRPSQ